MLKEFLWFIALIAVMIGGAAAMYALIRQLAMWLLEDDDL